MEGYTIIAVNEAEANNMKTAVRKYKEGLDEQLDKITKIDTTSYEQGFKGAQVQTIKAYIDATVDEMKKMSSFILEFESALDVVLANYAAKSSSIATGAVEEASVENQGDLAGVKPFGE